MGTPHQGAAGVLLGELVLRIASIFIRTDNKARRQIDQDSEWLQQQLQQYAPISQSFVIKFGYETMPTTSIAFGKKVMVSVHCEHLYDIFNRLLIETDRTASLSGSTRYH
jgi:hypothetical protein